MFNQDDNRLMLVPYCNFVWVFSVYTCSSFLSSFPQTLDGSQCKKLQEIVLNIMSGDLPTYVASFGNSDVNSVGDWVKILNSKPANEVNKCRVFDADCCLLLSRWVNDFYKITLRLKYFSPYKIYFLTAADIYQSIECCTAVRKVAGSIPGAGPMLRVFN